MLTNVQLEWLRRNSPGFAYAEACKIGAEANADDCARMATGTTPATRVRQPFTLVEREHA